MLVYFKLLKGVFISATLLSALWITIRSAGGSLDYVRGNNHFHKAHYARYIINRTLVESRLSHHHRRESSSSQSLHDDLSHFYLHIPKTGGYYAFGWFMSTLFHSPQMIQLPPEHRFRLCQLGVNSLNRRPSSYKNTTCTMWMSEQHYNKAASNTYTLVRDPRQHVLSQYFHCTESTDKQQLTNRRKTMIGSLDDWLSYWVDIGMNDPKPYTMQCYNPVNMQSRYVGYNPANPRYVSRPKDALVDLQQRFTVIGPMDQMDKVLCVMFIHYAGWIPAPCDCTDGEANNKVHDDNAVERQSSHGVVHHGNSYNTTLRQDELILKITEKDVLLYEGVKIIFNQHVEYLERKMNVTLCNRFVT